MDTTIICTVTDNTEKKSGKYQVTDGAAKFTAKTDANSRYYNVGDTVRVLAIKGDLGNCYISGKYSYNDESDPLTYISPSETVVSMTDNLITGKVDAWGITANGDDTQIPIWSANLTSSDYKDLQTNSIYNTLSLKADFKCLLSNYKMKAGTYGLILRLDVRPTNDNSQTISRWVSLDSTDMFGNPYSFMVYSSQEATFDISNLGTIESLQLFLYQNDDFEYYNNKGFPERLQPVDFSNILVKNVYLSFGSDLTKVEDNTLQIYTGDSTIYNISDDGSTSRDIGLLWYNKDEDNTYIGFSDGIYDPTYDEIHYLEESEVDSRLVAQMGKDVPNDEIALETAADIEDAQPIFKNLRNSLTRDLRNNLNAYQNQIASIESFNDDFEALMDSIALVGQQIEEYQKTMTEEYAEILSAAKKVQEGQVVRKPTQSVTILNVETKVNSVLKSTNQLLANTKTEIQSKYTGFMSIYDTYETRITKVQAAISGYLSQLNMLLSDDAGKLDAFFKPGYEFEPYGRTDFSEYDNKYCIYWYRYEPGYVDINERFLESGWHRLKDVNVGLPRARLSDDSIYNAKKPLSPEGILTLELDTQYIEEKYIAILFFNHNMYKSNVLTFTNANPPVDEKIADQTDACHIEHGDNSQLSYQVYGLNNLLVNAADGYRKRELLLRYEGLTAGDEALYGAQIFWYLPLNSTMLKYEAEDFDGTWSNDAKADPGVSSPYSKTGYVCFYKTIGGTESTDDEGNVTYTIANRDRYFTYRIKDYYSQSFTNNTIYCRVVKPNYYDCQTEISFVFSSFGTSGTDYTLVISPNTAKAAADGVLENGAHLPLGLALYDYDNNRLKILDSAPAVDNPDPYLANLEWIGPSAYYAAPVYNSDTKGYGVEKINITMSETQGPLQKYYNGILKATVPYPIDELGEIIDLVAVYAVPYTAGNYYIEGPGIVVYNSDGVNPTYYKNPYRIFRRTKVTDAEGNVLHEADSEITDVVWSIMYYKENGDIMTATDWGESSYAVLQSFMPKLNERNCLVPCHIFLENNGGTMVYPVVVCKDNDNVVLWAQPIYCMKNRYASAMVNKWDGSLVIDKDNGTIMSTMVGAGRKNNKNQFEGVLLGDVGSASEDNATGVGLYGFHEGAQSFNFNVDGTAFIGKSGRGRIKFNGNKGTITSASYEQAKESAGMMIDLDDGIIDMRGAKIDTTTGKYVADTASRIHVDVKSPYFKIDSVKGKTLMFIGGEKEGYYLQSDEYKETKFTLNETESNGLKTPTTDTTGTGMRLDLKNGTLDAFDFYLTSKNVMLNSKDSSKPYFVIKDNFNNMLMHIGSTKFWLKSADYSEDIHGNSEAGMKIDLTNGKIDAFNFKLVSSKVILSTTNPYFKIEGSDRTLMYVSDDSQYIQDNNGNMTINLNTGKITAKSFDLSAGVVDDDGRTQLLTLSSNSDKYPIEVSGGEDAFHVDWAGNVHCTNLKATGGSFKGKIVATGGTFTGTITGATILGGTLDIGSAGETAGSGKFSVASDGSITIGNKETFHVTSGGALTCTSATIGGWEVSESGFASGKMNITSGLQGGLDFGGIFTVDAKGTTIINDLDVVNTFEVLSKRGADSVLSVDSKGNLKVVGTLEVGTSEVNMKFLSNGLWITGADTATINTNKIQLGVGNDSAKTLIYHYLEVPEDTRIRYNGVVSKLPDYILKMFKEGGSEKGLGKLAFLDDVVISSSTFKLGSGSAYNVSPTVSGDTATFIINIPGQSYSTSGGSTSGHWVKVYANKDVDVSISDGTSGHPYYIGSVWADGEKYSGGSGTTDARQGTFTITVKAE